MYASTYVLYKVSGKYLGLRLCRRLLSIRINMCILNAKVNHLSFDLMMMNISL